MRAVVRGGFDTFAGEQAPSKEHGGNNYLRLSAASGATSYAYIYLKNPAPRGATITSATLHLRARGSWTGTITLTARRVADSWKASKLNWNNKPGVTGSSKTATITDAAGGDVIDIDVTQHLQTVVNGSAHYGWRIETDSTTVHRIHGFGNGDYKPTLTVEWVETPTAPTTLSPSGGAVSVSHPVLQWDGADLSNLEDLQAVQVQIDPAGNGSSPAFDSGEVSTDVPELDLSATAYVGLADGASTQWRVRQNLGGAWSDYSDWHEFSRVAKGALTIDNPAADPNNFVNEPTPPILWTFTGTQSAFRVRITDADDRTKTRYNSGRVKSIDEAHTLVKKWRNRRVLKDDRSYSLQLRVWDDVDRVATPGDPTYVQEWRDFTMDDDLTVAAPTLTAAQEGSTPWVELTFTRATAPDSWVVLRDGEVIESGIDPADVFSSGTTYVWRDWSASPQTEHTYQVKAVVGGKQSGASNTATVTIVPSGIWLIDFDRDIAACILGDDSGSFVMPEQAATYAPIGSDRVVRISAGKHGLTGTLTGTLIDALGRAATTQERHLQRMIERPADVYQLVLADVSIPVYLGDITIAPTPISSEGDIIKSVTFSFWQAGDLPFEVRL